MSGMVWYAVLGLAVVAIASALLVAASRPMNPYNAQNQPAKAPPRNSPGRRWWRRNARQGEPPGPPL